MIGWIVSLVIGSLLAITTIAVGVGNLTSPPDETADRPPTAPGQVGYGDGE